jgi:hypothetical protein
MEPNSAKLCHQIIDLGGLLTMTALEETKEGKTKEEKTEKVDGLVEHIMQEARMVLPGVQALFGFQLVCVFSQGFAQIPRS